MKRLAKLEPYRRDHRGAGRALLLPSPERPLAPPLIRLENARIGYGDDPPILRGLNLRLDIDDRIGLLGVNGAGKSTFAKLIAGALRRPLGPHAARAAASRSAGSTSTRSRRWTPTDTPLEIVRRDHARSQRDRTAARAWRSWGLGFAKAETTVADLSGGERARLLLNLVAMEAPHLLILDEPTNHLDIDSRRALLDALNDYEGAVILITHDRSLMELVADRLWLAADGTIEPFDGDMDDYARFVLDRTKAGTPAPTQIVRGGKKKKGKAA